LIDRSLLFELLDQGINHPLTLVVASAGFGKTTLVSAWLDRLAASQPGEVSSFPTAWLSLDENDSDLNIFLRYFIAALRTIFPDGCEETLNLLHSRSITPPEYLFANLSNEIEQLAQNFILVLDDYHTLHGKEVNDLFNTWARHWPKPLHLVLISRINPPLPIASLRAKGMVNEIRAKNLRFTTAETEAYLSQRQIAHLSPQIMALLEERFEGWPAGLHLAALSLRSHVSQETILSALSSENTNVTVYLVDEVLNHQYPAIHSFLLKTSILDRFCPSLCEAILGEIDPAWNVRACLDWIERSEIFITPLDNRREWYRYHHLFRELLEQQLVAEAGVAQEQNLHRLASVWFEERGLIEEAIQHALAAGEFDLAAHQMNAGLCEALNHEDRPTLERWLRLLPEELIQRRPELLIIRAWVLEFTWRLNQQAQVLHKIEEH
jgi:LuxR family maltose regulon positive regulatory protein